MPHVEIKYFPQDFTDEQRRRLTEAITSVVTEHFGVQQEVVSLALEPVAETDWYDTVVGPEIMDRRHLLVKEPDYIHDTREDT